MLRPSYYCEIVDERTVGCVLYGIGVLSTILFKSLIKRVKSCQLLPILLHQQIKQSRCNNSLAIGYWAKLGCSRSDKYSGVCFEKKATAFTDANWIKQTLISDLSRPYICTLCTFHSLECALEIEAEHTIQLDRLILQCGFACIKDAELSFG